MGVTAALAVGAAGGLDSAEGLGAADGLDSAGVWVRWGLGAAGRAWAR